MCGVYGMRSGNTRKNRVYGPKGEKVGRGPARRPFVPPSQKPGVPKASEQAGGVLNGSHVLTGQ